MPIQVVCPHCQAKLNAPDSLAGKKIKCPKCSQIGAVPTTNEPPTTQWHVQMGDGSEYGPVSRTELDEWFREERITEDCQLLKEGSDQWQWATDVYPSLAPQPATPAMPQAKALQPKASQPTIPQRTPVTSQPPALEPIYDDPPAVPFGAPSTYADPFAAGNNSLAGEFGLQPVAAPLQPAPLKPTTYSSDSYNPYTAPAQPMLDSDENINELSPLGRVGIFIFTIPLVFCCNEMAPGWGMFGMSALVGIPLVMFSGMIGGAMIGGRYFIPGAIGGVVASFGAAIATVAHLAAVNETHTALMAIIGLIGALPGIGLYFLGKLIQKLIFPRRAT